MPFYALVDMAPNEDNLFPVTNVETRNTTPPPLNGFRWLTEADIAEGAEARIGWYWDGVLPATFVEKPPVDLSGPETQTEALNLALDALDNARLAVEQALAKG